MNKRQFVKSVAATSIGLVAAQALSLSAGERTPLIRASDSERRRARFPNVPVATHDGNLVRFYDDLIKDRIVLINFMYARCGDICPGMTANLKKVHAALGVAWDATSSCIPSAWSPSTIRRNG